MKKTLTLIAAFVLLAAGAVAQKLSYSAVVRDSDNKLVANQNITVAIAIANGENDNPVYGETHSATTNQNGLVTLTIGEGTGKTGSLSAVTWPTAHITSTFSLPGGAQVVSTAPANAVPYALYADNVGNVDYSNISNTPDIPAAANDATLTIQKNGNTVGTFTANASTDATVNVTVPTRTSELENNSGYITQTDLNNLASQYQHLLDNLGGVVSAQQTAIAALQATLTEQQAIIDSLCNAGSVPVTAITLNKTETTISAGNTETLSVNSVTPDNATDQTVTWSSDNEAVATVNATTGEVTAVALGTANITATANDGSGVTATCAVTVNKVVTINQSDWAWSSSFTKDGVTVSASMIDPMDGNLMGGGTFSTTLGNFTKIVVTTQAYEASGTGWSGGTWAGTPASTVSFSGDFMGFGMTQTTIVCTIAPTN